MVYYSEGQTHKRNTKSLVRMFFPSMPLDCLNSSQRAALQSIPLSKIQPDFPREVVQAWQLIDCFSFFKYFLWFF